MGGDVGTQSAALVENTQVSPRASIAVGWCALGFPESDYRTSLPFTMPVAV